MFFQQALIIALVHKMVPHLAEIAVAQLHIELKHDQETTMLFYTQIELQSGTKNALQ